MPTAPNGSGCTANSASRYLSAHDQAVLEAAREWEARQRQMYPISN